MATSELGACEWFTWDLRRSNLIDRGQLDGVVGEFLSQHPGAEPPALAEYLVAQGILTQFQADRLLEGKTQGFVLGPYTLMDALGSGSMGTVYKAVSKTDNKFYAVKVLPRRSMWNVRIARRKVRMYEKCRHPAVVPFVDVGTSGGMHYLAWPLVEGETLDKIVAREGKLSPALAALYALQTAQGMAVCHAQGLFHGLLKPSNLMISPEGQVRILDLGIGGLLAETEGESLVDTMSSANSLASGLDCGSPESLMDPNNLSPIGDQYSLGCVLYYCLTGRYPFPDGSAVDKMMAHQMREPEAVNDLNPEVPEALAEVVDRLMQKAPEARYPNTQEIIDALQPLAGPAAQRVPRSGMVRDARLPRRPALASLGDSTPLELRMKSAPGLNEPVRNLSSMALPRTRAPAAASATPNDVPVQPARTPPFPMPQASNPFAVLPQPTLEERLGPVGIAICAIIACAMAWLVTWKLF